MDKLLIWDIDGTLIQGREIGRRSMDIAFFDLYGIESGFKLIDMAGRIDAVILSDAYKFHNISNKDSKAYFDRYSIILNQEVKKLNAPIEAPGILSLLEAINPKPDFYCVLGTGNTERAARIKLSYHDMNKYFTTGGFGDNEQERWQVILEAINNAKSYFTINFTSENIYVIGDTPRDIECGKKIGVKTIGVATGYFTTEQLKDCCADYVFDDFLDMEKFFKIF